MSRDPENRSQTVAELMAALTPLIDALSQPYYLVPNPPSAIAEAQFLGREKQLCELSKLLREHNLVFLSGVGGIGKSELAAQFARRQQDMLVLHATYSAGNPESKDDIDRSGLKQLILSLPIVNYPAPPQLPKLDDLGNLVDGQRRNYPRERKDYYDKKLTQLRALCRENVMLIVDNFNVDSDEGLEDLESLGCKTILTTWCDYQSLYPDQQLTLENSNAEDWTVELFCHQTKRPLNRDKVREIVRRVEYHTTAVILLGAQLQADYLDEDKLLERLNHSLSDVGTANVPFRKDGTARRDQRSFAYLQAIFDMAKLDEAEQQLLIKLSFLSAQPFTMDMLREWEPELDMNAFNQLVTYRWISEDQYPTFHLPQVVADVVFESAGEKVMGALEFVKHIERLSQENKEIILAVSNQLVRIPESTYDTSEGLSVEVSARCNNLAYLLNHQGKPEKAETLHREAIDIRRKLAQKDPESYEEGLATSCNNLAYLLAHQGEPEEAETLYREAIDIRRRLAQKNPEAYEAGLAISCNNLAYLLNHQGKPEKAETLYREAIEIRRRLVRKVPEAYIGLATDCDLLACVLVKQGKTEDAERIYREAIEIRRQLAQNDPETYEHGLAISCGYLAILLNKQGKTEDAERILREAIEICRKLARKNPAAHETMLAATCSYLASILEEQGQTDEAERFYCEALGILRKLVVDSFEGNARFLAKCCTDYAELLCKRNDVAATERIIREAILIYQILVQNTPQEYDEMLADNYARLAILCRVQNDHYGAEFYCHKALVMYRAIQVTHTPTTMDEDELSNKVTYARKLLWDIRADKYVQWLKKQTNKLRRKRK